MEQLGLRAGLVKIRDPSLHLKNGYAQDDTGQGWAATHYRITEVHKGFLSRI